jgi:GTP-binding protein
VAFDEELAARPAVVVGTKADLVDRPVDVAARLGDDAAVVSAMTGDGIEELAERLGLLAREAEAAQPERTPTVVLRPGRPRFTVTRRTDGGWEVHGRAVERWVLETDLDDDQQVARLQARLKKDGVDRTLAANGAKPGDDVYIRGQVFEFVPDATPLDGPTGAQEPADA